MANITAEQLHQQLSEPNPPVVLDVRSGQAYDNSDERIAGDVRIAPEEVDARVPNLDRSKRYVAY